MSITWREHIVALREATARTWCSALAGGETNRATATAQSLTTFEAI